MVWCFVQMLSRFTDARVRKAVRLAADRQEIVDLVYGGGAVVACDTPVEPNDQYRADLKCPSGYRTGQSTVGRGRLSRRD